MKTILFLIFAAFLLTSCSNPDTSGGVTLSRGGDHGNEFPYGSCEGPHKKWSGLHRGCGWLLVDDKRYYIMPVFHRGGGVNLSGLDLRGRNLNLASFYNANLSHADLRGTSLHYIDAWQTNFSHADLRSADLKGADFGRADLTGADLRGASLWRARTRDGNRWVAVKADSSTICPNLNRWGTVGHDCPF
jgi:hypothetical protein